VASGGPDSPPSSSRSPSGRTVPSPSPRLTRTIRAAARIRRGRSIRPAHLRSAPHSSSSSTARSTRRSHGRHRARPRGSAAALRSCRESGGFDYIATAHQQNDQAETILIRLLTGTGPGRLAGIPPQTRDGIIRPLLDVPREEIERFLRDRGIELRRDRMNRDPRFLRTRIREEVLPLLEQFNPRIASALAETAKQGREQQDAVRWMLAELSDRWIRRTPSSSAFDLAALPEIGWIRRAIRLHEIQRLEPAARDLSAADLERLARGLPTLRRTSVTKRLELVREGSAILLRARPEATLSWERTIEPGERIRLPGDRDFGLERLGISPPGEDVASPAGSRVARQRFQLPEDAKERSFVVRNRRRGDRLRPSAPRREKGRRAPD
jgi:tRNA(Ile)-lysidine synthase